MTLVCGDNTSACQFLVHLHALCKCLMQDGLDLSLLVYPWLSLFKLLMQWMIRKPPQPFKPSKFYLYCLRSPNGSKSVVFSIASIAVPLIAPRVTPKPIFWTLSHFPRFVLDAVAQEREAYSIMGPIAPAHTCFSIFVFASQDASASFFLWLQVLKGFCLNIF